MASPGQLFNVVHLCINIINKQEVTCLIIPLEMWLWSWNSTVYPKKYAHGFVVLCFVVVTQSFIMNSHEVFIHIHQGCFAGTGAIVRLPQCQWSKPDGYWKISQCITTTKHSKAKTVCIHSKATFPTFGNRCLSAIGGGKQRSRLAGWVQLSAEAAPGPHGVPPAPPGRWEPYRWCGKFTRIAAL